MASDDGLLPPTHLNSFQAGASVSKKLAVASGYYYSQSLDNRSDPSQLSVLPAPSTIASNLEDLITAMDQDLNGVRWGIGSNGGLYSISTSDGISKRANLSEDGSAGILYNQVTDQLYIPGQTTVSMYGQVTTGVAVNPKFRLNQFAQSASIAPGCVNLYNSTDGFFDGTVRNNVQSLGVGITETVVQSGAVVSASVNTYAVPVAISEDAGNFCYFAPDIEPFYSIMVYVGSSTAAGSGPWTLTLHDSLNNQLAAITLTNAQVIAQVALNNGYVEFVFGSQIRALVNASQTGNSATYHFHVTTTGTGATAGVINAGDLSSCDFLLFAYRLVQTNNGWHPATLFTGSGVPLLCIGNGQYLSTYNFGNDANPTNNQWQRHNLTFEQGYEVCGLTKFNQYLVIAVERRSKVAGRSVQDGALYLWDGSTNAPSIFVDIPMGSPYSIYTFNNVVYFACSGSLFAYAGSAPIKVRKLAYQNTDYLNMTDTTIVNPNMFTCRYNVLMMGYPSSTTNTNINYGVWSWGTVELTFPNSYVFSYMLANGYLNNISGLNLQIGCVYNFVDSMYMSWQFTDSNGVLHYGMDLLNNSSVSAPTYSWQSLIWDGGVSWKIKLAKTIKVSCRTLPEGATLQVGYSLDGGEWVWSPSVMTGAHGQTITVNKRFHEIQYGFQGTTAGTSSPPVIIGVTLDVNPLMKEVTLIAEQ